MRAMLMAAVGVAVCFTLSGCDQNQQQAQTAAVTPVAIAPPPPCKCQQAAAAPTITIAHHTRHRMHRHGHTLDEFLAYSTGPSSYGETDSRTVREYRPGDEERYAEYDHTEMHDSVENRHVTDADVWVDGYGKAHYADYGPIEDEHPGLISRKDEHERMRPYRGYDSNCDNGID